jgi:hypothetical protein
MGKTMVKEVKKREREMTPRRNPTVVKPLP